MPSSLLLNCYYTFLPNFCQKFWFLSVFSLCKLFLEPYLCDQTEQLAKIGNSVIKKLDGVYITVAKIADLAFRISLQASNEVHFFSFLSHSTRRKESFEPLWNKIAIEEQRHNQDPNMG